MRKYLAEALGTFTLSLVVALAVLKGFPVALPVLAALVVGLFVYTTGSISGAHLNPAITIGAWSIKKISSREAGIYIVAQLIGAALAMVLIQLIVPNVPAAALPGNTLWLVGLAELVGAFFFAWGIASVLYGRTSSSHGGIVIGGSLLLGITIAALMGSLGIINPAVALAARSFSLMYVLGPIVGAVLGFQMYRAMITDGALHHSR